MDLPVRLRSWRQCCAIMCGAKWGNFPLQKWGRFPIFPIMEKLIEEITAYCAAKGISPGTFGSYAIRDGKFFGRIAKGGECLPKTAERVRAYMRENPVIAESAAADGA